MNHDQAMIAKIQGLKEKLNDVATGIIKNANDVGDPFDKANDLLQLTRTALERGFDSKENPIGRRKKKDSANDSQLKKAA